ncbi:MAG: tripartite tricarboxylate transporter substrate binding protein [Firmicutes bacterium]|nr:tripartite tricarboxylate transporter substrate binding protein [Bacillota bacterium]
MRRAVVLVAVLVLLAGLVPGSAAPAYPSKALEFIAPAGPGGGWDTTARMTAKALAEEKLITVPISVINMPGGSGAVGIAHMVTRRRGDTHVLAVMGSALTGTLARRAVPYTYRDVTPIVAITADYQVIAVRKDSTFNTLKTLLEVFKRDPGAITVGGGSAPGALDHLTFAQLAGLVGVDVTKVRYVPFGDGAAAMASILGGTTTVLSSSLSETLANIEAGQIRVLAVTAPQRLGGALRDIPTAREQGVDFVFANWRGFYMPPETPAEVVRFWEDTFAKMLGSRTWARILQETRWEPFVLTGDRLRQFLDRDLTTTQSVLRDLGLIR